MASPLAFPTVGHHRVADLAYEFFADRPHVDTFLIVNSCARGRADRDSDLDLAVLLDTGRSAAGEVRAGGSAKLIEDLEAAWLERAARDPLVREFEASGPFARVHLDVFDGVFVPSKWDDGGGPDAFEIEIGNRVAHAQPLRDSGPWFREMRSRWLPYYDEPLRERRLSMVAKGCEYDLAHIPMLVARGLHFQAFDRLYKAFQEFLQALFISRRTYPVAYNKWIRDQVEGWLALPDLYRELPAILSVGNVASAELSERAVSLQALLDRVVLDS